MKHSIVAKFQIGKQGLTDAVLNSLAVLMKNHKQIRISVLKSCCRDREELKKIAQRIEHFLPQKLKVRIIGYTIILVKL